MAKKKLSKDEVHWTPRNVFNIPVGFCPSKKAWDNCMKRYCLAGVEYNNTVGARCNNFVDKHDQQFIVIQVNDHKGRTRREIDGLIIHEVVHAFFQMCDHVGEESPSEEFRSYFIQGLFMEISTIFEETIGYGKA